MSRQERGVILITGGSRGIGAATAQLAAQHGCSVCINYLRNSALAESLAARIQAEGGAAVAIQANAANPADVTSLFDQCDEFGRLVALVNNAAILEKQMRVVDMDAQRLNRVFGTNVVGAFLCAQAAVRRMSTSLGGNGGTIVNVSSVAARLGAPAEYVDYAASKGAIDSMTIGLAREVAGEGIRVNAVCPAYIHTDIHSSGGDPDRVHRVAPTLPMKRGGQPEEVARAILWLLSDESSYTTGTFIDVAGGL